MNQPVVQEPVQNFTAVEFEQHALCFKASGIDVFLLRLLRESVQFDTLAVTLFAGIPIRREDDGDTRANLNIGKAQCLGDAQAELPNVQYRLGNHHIGLEADYSFFILWTDFYSCTIIDWIQETSARHIDIVSIRRFLMKRLFIVLLSILIAMTVLTPSLAAATTKTAAQKVDIYALREKLTAKQVVSEMKIGSNLGGYYDLIDWSFKTGYDKRSFTSASVGVALWLYDDDWKNSAFEWLAFRSDELTKGETKTFKVLLKNMLSGVNDFTKLNNVNIGFRLANGKNSKITAIISNTYIQTPEGKKYKLDDFDGKRTFSHFEQDQNGHWFECMEKRGIGLPSEETLKNSTFYMTVKILDAPAAKVTKNDSWINQGNAKTDAFKMVDVLQKAGYNSVRLNISWTPHMNDKTFAIDKDWLDAVQKIVDYILKKDMYVILNSHYDYLDRSWVGDHWADNWMSEKYETYVNTRFAKMWEQIAARFNGYGDKLIFEAANEMNEAGNTGTGIEKRASRVNMLNSLFIQTIRATGGNNAKRFLSIGGVSEVAGNLEYMELPKDDHLIVQVHYYYNPPDYVVGWNEVTNSVNHTLDKATWKWNMDDEKDKHPIDDTFDKIKSFADKTGVPVILGEWGSTEAFPLTDRANLTGYILAKAKALGMPCFWWECGIGDSDTPASIFDLYDRNAKKWRQPNLLKAIMDVVYS